MLGCYTTEVMIGVVGGMRLPGHNPSVCELGGRRELGESDLLADHQKTPSPHNVYRSVGLDLLTCSYCRCLAVFAHFSDCLILLPLHQ